MKELNRNPLTSASSRAWDDNDFCVCRVLENCALIKIESRSKLRAAKKYMRQVAADVPGSYVIFSNRSRRVLGRLISRVSA
jgi:hypothetical protein